MNLDHIDLSQSSWSQNLFRRMDFLRRFGTTGKVSIPEALRKELEIQCPHDIFKKTEENNIPASLVLNLGQTPWNVCTRIQQNLGTKRNKNCTNKRMEW